jgi:hypothetical protein
MRDLLMKVFEYWNCWHALPPLTNPIRDVAVHLQVFSL